jgi:predicted NBD/HSP70 family sugar kinase
MNMTEKMNPVLELDPYYCPAILEYQSFINAVLFSKNPQKVTLAIERHHGYISRFETFVFHDDEQKDEENKTIIERIVKSLLWMKGGYKIYYSGPLSIGVYLKGIYGTNALRNFDVQFMKKIYEHPFSFDIVHESLIPQENENAISLGRNLNGCRIGFDAGGSDRKVSAVIDGVTVYSEETVWSPKLQQDPNYHYQGILDSIKRAASKMPHLDAIGVSSAGVFIEKRIMAASLFMSVTQGEYEPFIKDMYLNIAKELGNVQIEVANDGDVTALSGAMNLNVNNILGIAMGTSEAAGYINKDGNITGWLNELAFVPVDFNKDSEVDEWSSDYGCGVKYFSQDAVIRLARKANIALSNDLTLGEQLKIVQSLAELKDLNAIEVFKTIGIYLGYSIAYYHLFYQMEHVMILGRVTSGYGGQLIIDHAKALLKNEFSELYQTISITMPNEMERRVGQSIAAASLPYIK